MWLLNRGTEVVESTVRQHIGACFSALEQRVLATLSDASHQLATGAAPGGSPTDKLLQQVHPLTLSVRKLSHSSPMLVCFMLCCAMSCSVVLLPCCATYK